MLQLDPADIVALPIDELGLLIATDMVATKEWNEHNYVNWFSVTPPYNREDVQRAVSEAIGWLRSAGLLARKPGGSEALAIFVTRAGQRAINEGLAATRARLRLSGDLHPRVLDEARPQFLLGRAELGVFGAMKAIEVRVRALAGFDDAAFGVDLMNRAFGPTGPLTDPSRPKGEQEGVRSLFVGAYAVLRNPSGHLDVDYEDLSEAAEGVATASLLMRILDRVERRIAQ